MIFLCPDPSATISRQCTQDSKSFPESRPTPRSKSVVATRPWKLRENRDHPFLGGTAGCGGRKYFKDAVAMVAVTARKEFAKEAATEHKRASLEEHFLMASFELPR